MAMDFGKLNFAVSFKTTSAFPLEANSYFEDLAAAQAAAATAVPAGSADSVYYIGQLIIVTSGGVSDLYQIEGTVGNTSLKKFGQASSAEELKADLDALKARYNLLVDALSSFVDENKDESGNVTSYTVHRAAANHDGIMRKEQVQKLGGIEAGANKTIVDDALTDDGTNPVQGGIIKKAIDAERTRAEGVEGTHTTAIESLNTDVSDLKNQITGLTGAMHFIGVSTTDPAGDTGATVEGHATFESGDVCLYGTKEFVYNGTKWIELGDEGSHLTKTEAAATYETIANATTSHDSLQNQIKAVATDFSTFKNETIVQKFAEVQADIDSKVDAVEGKSLVDDTLITKMEGLKDNVVIKEIGNGLSLSTEGSLSTNVKIADVSGLQTELDKKQTAAQVNSLIQAATIKGSKVDGAVAEASSVTHSLTAGAKTFNGSADVEITAADLGALTTIPAATASKLGGVKIGSGIDVTTDGTISVTIPKALITSVDTANFNVTVDGELQLMRVSTDEIVQGSQTLVLDGGLAEDF